MPFSFVGVWVSIIAQHHNLNLPPTHRAPSLENLGNVLLHTQLNFLQTSFKAQVQRQYSTGTDLYRSRGPYLEVHG